MSVFGLLFRFLKTYRVEDGLPEQGIRKVRSLAYLLVVFYTFVIMRIVPGLQDVQPVNLQDFILGESVWLVIGLTVVLGPLMEELLFRAGMKRGGKNVSWLAGAVIYFLLTYFFAGYLDLAGNQLYQSLISYSAYLLCVVIGFWLLKPWFPKISRVYVRWPGMIFWLLTLGFSLAHVTNFVSGGWMVLLLVVPQLILGIMLGFVRIQRGLGRSMLIHMFHNLIQLIPILLLKYFIGLKTVKIEQVNFSNLTTMQMYGFLAIAVYFVGLFGFVSYQIIQEIIIINQKK